MKVIARASSNFGGGGRVLVEMDDADFCKIIGKGTDGRFKVEIGDEFNVHEAFWKLHKLDLAHVGNIADQLEAVAKLLRPLDGLVREVQTPKEGD